MENKRYTKKNNVTAEITEQKRQNRSRNRIVFYIALFLIITAVFAGIFVFFFLKVEEINVLGNTAYTTEKILDVAGIEVGDNLMQLFGTDKGDLITEKLPYIERVDIRIRLPHTVDIKIYETKAVFYTQIDNDCYLLSDELKVLSRVSRAEVSDMGLCRIYTSPVKRCVVGEICSFADKREYNALTELYSLFKKSDIQDKVPTVNAENRFEITFDYDGRFEVYLGNMDHCDIKIRFLVEILKQLDPDDKGKIDLSDHTTASVRLE